MLNEIFKGFRFKRKKLQRMLEKTLQLEKEVFYLMGAYGIPKERK